MVTERPWAGNQNFDGTSFQKQTLKTLESELDLEWGRQARRLAKFFAGELGMTKANYIGSLPEFETQPEIFKGRLNTPVIVEMRIPIKRQCELTGIIYHFIEELNKKDRSNNEKGYSTLNPPYTMWCDEGMRSMNREARDVRANLADDERGGTEYDGVALYIAKPRILEKRYLDLPGTAVGSLGTAYLCLRKRQPRLSFSLLGNAHPRFGSLICGRQK